MDARLTLTPLSPARLSPLRGGDAKQNPSFVYCARARLASHPSQVSLARRGRLRELDLTECPNIMVDSARELKALCSTPESGLCLQMGDPPAVSDSGFGLL